MLLSVCIVNWNTRDYLRETLASLLANPPADAPMEIVVVDNASTDGSAAMVRREFPEARLAASTVNHGYAAGNNIALAAASGDALLLLNPDVRVLPGALDAALDALRSAARVGAASVRFRDSDGALQASLRGFPEPAALAYELLGVSRLLPRARRWGGYFLRWFDYDRPLSVDQPMGTFLMIARRAYDEVGGMDPAFPIFFNEVDWCYRAKQRGWEIVFTPAGEIVHYGGRGTRQAPRAAMVRESHRSLIGFYDKHYRAGLPPRLYAAITAAIRLGERARLTRARR